MLFFKECKKILFSLTFLLYLAAMCAMYFTQFDNDCGQEPIAPPRPGMENYGTIAKEVPEILMPAAVDRLISSYLGNSYHAYPMGFYKDVHLKEKPKAQMAEIITELSGITKEQLDAFTDFETGEIIMDENGSFAYKEPKIPEADIPESLTYQRFRELMAKADKLIGGGSEYSDAYLVKNFSRVPKTYEDALLEYQQFLEKDKITGAYARLYCDYMGIVAAILPVFVAVSFVSLDAKSRMEQLVYSRKISSAKLIFLRYGALIFMMALPVIVTALKAQWTVESLYPDKTLDHFALLKGAVTWVIPNIMLASAAGMLITEFSSGLFAIFVQGAWWIASLFAGTGSLTGNIGRFTLVLRHNSLYKLNEFLTEYDNFVFNRIFYTTIALTLTALTVFLYEQKRRGFYGLFISLQNFNHKSKA